MVALASGLCLASATKEGILDQPLPGKVFVNQAFAELWVPFDPSGFSTRKNFTFWSSYESKKVGDRNPDVGIYQKSA